MERRQIKKVHYGVRFNGELACCIYQDDFSRTSSHSAPTSLDVADSLN